MSTAVPGPINPQLQCEILLLPTEIRRFIYNHVISSMVHVFVKDDRVHISPCMESASAFADGSECKPLNLDDRQENTLWGRRLTSWWGPHWECEEVAMASDGTFGGRFPIALTCKAMYRDFGAFLIDNGNVCLTDLHVFDLLLRNWQAIKSSSVTRPSELSPYSPISIMHNMTTLNISLRFPWHVCKHLDNLGIYKRKATECFDLPEHMNDPYRLAQKSAWLRLPEIISYLGNVKKITMWLDHDEICPWSAVNERALLSHLSEVSNLTVDMPDHAPHLAAANWHYLPSSPEAAFKVRRRPGQEWRGVRTKEETQKRWDSFRVAHKSDFPCYMIYAESPPPRMETEVFEIETWKVGTNVIRFQAERAVLGLSRDRPFRDD